MRTRVVRERSSRRTWLEARPKSHEVPDLGRIQILAQARHRTLLLPEVVPQKEGGNAIRFEVSRLTSLNSFLRKDAVSHQQYERMLASVAEVAGVCDALHLRTSSLLLEARDVYASLDGILHFAAVPLVGGKSSSRWTLMGLVGYLCQARGLRFKLEEDLRVARDLESFHAAHEEFDLEDYCDFMAAEFGVVTRTLRRPEVVSVSGEPYWPSYGSYESGPDEPEPAPAVRMEPASAVPMEPAPAMPAEPVPAESSIQTEPQPNEPVPQESAAKEPAIEASVPARSLLGGSTGNVPPMLRPYVLMANSAKPHASEGAMSEGAMPESAMRERAKRENPISESAIPKNEERLNEFAATATTSEKAVGEVSREAPEPAETTKAEVVSIEANGTSSDDVWCTLVRPRTGEEFSLPLDETLTLGRSPECSVQLLGNPDISRRQATILCEEDSCVLCDLGSANGTSVHGRELDESESARLLFGEKFKLAGEPFFVRKSSGL